MAILDCLQFVDMKFYLDNFCGMGMEYPILNVNLVYIFFMLIIPFFDMHNTYVHPVEVCFIGFTLNGYLSKHYL